MTVIGYRRSEFDTKDGKHISGVNIYCTYPIKSDQGEGEGVERYYFTDEKLARSGYSPTIGDEITVLWNQYGKPESIDLVG